MPSEYDVGFMYIKTDGETEAIVFRITASSKEEAKTIGQSRFKRTFPKEYQIMLHHIAKVLEYSYQIWIWYTKANKEKEVWYHFIPQANSETLALEVATRVFYHLHNSPEIKIDKKEISRFWN